MRHTRAVVVMLVVISLPSAGAAQDTTRSAAQNTPRSAEVRCDGKRITGITIVPQRPPIIGEGTSWWRQVLLAALLQHKTTNEDVVRSFLQLKTGGTCSEFRREESERVLRAQPFLANAVVRAVPDSAGVQIVVETVDEIPIVIGGSISRGTLSSARFGNANVLGRGEYAAVRWKQGFAYRDGFGVRAVDYHTLGEPLRFVVDAERGTIGGRALASFGYPFFTNLQRTAWHTGISYVKDYTSFARPDTEGNIAQGPELTVARTGRQAQPVG